MKKIINKITVVILLIVMCVALFSAVGCSDNSLYTKVSRAKELAQNIEKLPNSYNAIENGLNEKNKVSFVSPANALYSNGTSVQSANIEIEDVPNGDFYANGKYENVFAGAAAYANSGNSVCSGIDVDMNAVRVIKYYKNIALETVKQLSVWVEAPKQSEKKYKKEKLPGNYYIQKPAFRINYDVNADVVKLECKGRNTGGFELYIKAYCSYNVDGKMVFSVLFQYLSGYGEENHTPNKHIIPQMEVTNIYYVEDDCMFVQNNRFLNRNYYGDLSREEFYRAYDEAGDFYSDKSCDIIDLKTGYALIGFRNDYNGAEFGRHVDYITKYNNYIAVVELFERRSGQVSDLVTRVDDEENFVPYQKRAFEATILDENEVALAVITNKKAWISSNVTESQRSDVEHFFNLHQFDNVELCGVSEITEGIEFVSDTIEEKRVEELSAKEVFAIMDEPVINHKSQIADNEIFSLLDFNVQGKAALNTGNGEIDISNIKAAIPQSILLTEGAEYSLVLALKGTNSFVELASSSASYNGQAIEIRLDGAVDCKRNLETDEYVLIVYIAKNTDEGKIRLSDFYYVISDASAHYRETWLDVVEGETDVKTYDYVYEVSVSAESITVSQRYEISLSPKQ